MKCFSKKKRQKCHVKVKLVGESCDGQLSCGIRRGLLNLCIIVANGISLIDSTQYACPGRLNQANLFIKRFGIFFGQCSEICWWLNMFSNTEKSF